MAMGNVINYQDAKRFVGFNIGNVVSLNELAGGEKLAPYIGLVGYNNLGDELLFAAHQALFPNHRFIPYRKDTYYLEKAADIINKPFCDHAILGGGTLINDGEVWLDKAQHLLDRGTKIFCIGTGAETADFNGEDDNSGKLIKKWVKLLNRFEFVGVRGPQSKAILLQAGASSKLVNITGDTALALTEENLTKPPSINRIGITYGDVKGNPMWGSPEVYKREMIKFIKSLISSGVEVVLLPIWEKDVPSNKAILEAVNHPRCIMIKAYSSYADFKEEAQRCDYFIGQKLHASIIAYMNGVSTIMIEYRPKCRDFMESIEMEKYLIRTSDFTSDGALKLLESLTKNTPAVLKLSRQKILDYKGLQFKRAAELSSLFEHA